jgi:cell division protein FtsL
MINIIDLFVILILIICFLIFLKYSIKAAAKEELTKMSDQIERMNAHIKALSVDVVTLIKQEIEKLKNEK